jgi:hypothetical protein
MAENHADLRPQIVAAFVALGNAGELRVITQLGKCGRDARDALPLLRKLKLHPAEAVRTAADAAIAQIEEALASGPAPPRKEEPMPRTEPRPDGEDVSLPRELRPLVARLKSGTTEERVKAAADLAEMGEKALPAAGALCEVALAPSQKQSRAALEALKQVHPELHDPVFVLLVDEKADNHKNALKSLALLTEQGKPATPIVLHEIKRCQELLNDPQARWGQPTLVEVTSESMTTLSKIAPDDPKVLKTIIDLTKFTFPNGRRFGVGTVPFRQHGLELLGELAEGQPGFRKQIIPPVVAILKEAVQHTNAPDDNEVVNAISWVDLIGKTLLNCGEEAKPTLVKEVVPRLKQLQFHKSETVRKTAEDLRKKIEDGP